MVSYKSLCCWSHLVFMVLCVHHFNISPFTCVTTRTMILNISLSFPDTFWDLDNSWKNALMFFLQQPYQYHQLTSFSKQLKSCYPRPEKFNLGKNNLSIILLSNFFSFLCHNKLNIYMPNANNAGVCLLAYKHHSIYWNCSFFRWWSSLISYVSSTSHLSHSSSFVYNVW